MKKACSVANCSAPMFYSSSGYCKRHYMQVWKYGELRPDLDQPFASTICLVEKCGAAATYRNLCRGHYWQVNNNLPITSIVRGKIPCMIKDCPNHSTKKGLCPGHNEQYVGGKPFKPLREQANSRKKAKNCLSSGCPHGAHAKGLCETHYVKKHQVQRGQRLNGTPCAICKETRGTHRCHITPAREGGTFEKSNIIPLCPTHHWCFDHNTLIDSELEIIMAEEQRCLTT